MATEQYEIYQQGTAAALAEVQLALLNSKASPDASYPSLSAGSATGITGDVETASWMARQTNADGAALIESVKGNTLRWNQLVQNGNFESTAGWGATGGATLSVSGGVMSISGTTSTYFEFYISGTQYRPTAVSGHKYLFVATMSTSTGRATLVPTGAAADGTINFTGLSTIKRISSIWTSPANKECFGSFRFIAQSQGTSETITATISNYNIFDLTAMFGAGNEPATVAEFEALFPLPYYPYDAGSLLPVRMTGVETNGFNQWDEQWEPGYIGSNGANASSNSCIRSKNHIPVFPSTEYYVTVPRNLWTRCMFYDADKAFISGVDLNSTRTLTTPDNAAFMRFYLSDNYGTTYNHDICINISDPARNGTYEPYWSSQRTVPATDLRSAGVVRDELTETQAITRVGAVDLGTLTWEYVNSGGTFFKAALNDAAFAKSSSTIPNDTCALYTTDTPDRVYSGAADKTIAQNVNKNLMIHDTAYTDAAAFKTAMNGVMLYYELAAPTTTPIDPPLPMSYRVGAGGTERVMVAEGTTSAPPIFATRYPLDPADLAASIAPVDGPTAKSNHAVGELVMLGFTLCKVTTAIATGETIAIGTNVTRTTVAAEIAALS